MSIKLKQGIVIGLAAASIALSLHLTGLLTGLESVSSDFLARSLARKSAATDKIKLIIIDQDSLDWMENVNGCDWPWPRSVYAPILEFCRRAGARAVAFDITFTERDSDRPDEDREFGRAVAAASNYVQGFMPSQKSGNRTKWPAEVPRPNIAIERLDEFLESSNNDHVLTHHASFPILDVATNAALLASVSMIPDPGGIIRRILPFYIFDGEVIPSLGMAAFMSANPDAKLSVRNGTLHIGPYMIPMDARGSAILRFVGRSQTHEAISADAVIQSELRIRQGAKPVVTPELFKDCYVFIGTSAPDLPDLHATPISSGYPGVEIHATVLDNLLSNSFVRMPPMGCLIVLTLFFALASALATRCAGNSKHLVLAILLISPLPFVASFLAYQQGYWLRMIIMQVASGLALAGGLVANYAVEGRQKRFIKNAFTHYLSPHLIDQMLQDPAKLTLGGQSRELTILFSDIRGFTHISEQLPPEQLTSLITDYLTAMTDIILSEGATLDKYQGDAIIAFWNAPMDVPDHAIRACCAALRCEQKLAELRPLFRARCGHDIVARTGINSGPVVVGNMGSHHQFRYTFLGDAGNLASRLEGVNKQFGTAVIISEFTYSLIGNEFPARELSRVRVVGRQEPVTIYEPMLPEQHAERASSLKAFQISLADYYAGRFEQAHSGFIALSCDDAAARAYAARCEFLKAHPPSDWDGVWNMTEK